MHRDREVVLVESTRVLHRKRFHRQKLHLVLSGMRHLAAELGDRATYLRTETYREALERVGRPVVVHEPTSPALRTPEPQPADADAGRRHDPRRVPPPCSPRSMCAATTGRSPATQEASSWNSSTLACGANCCSARTAVELASVATFLPPWMPCVCEGRNPDHALFGCGLLRYCQRDGCDAAEAATLANLPTTDEPRAPGR
ncbi:cryptochrome/photolyase family protein [Pseudonocardia charpentierae]|uniref:Cryptochrome/photolyase family protein n=1 Tax=Pseudonocardia charpentierae TaxID=3075545 RepID=A0ABU2NCR4_9PSEU|nr:cryptochrome/photolyase family protein [Pseudonocardia sp. DSM 45834]MDT0351664.1 cryptochrome/photolyase family protein [Pseudonocardia sp. DSM 45834]